ncbi:putative Cyclic peptide transporter [Candidatus Methylopumilus planktonicus]|uniref:Putative Cyclic peptide transporter n=2 Tax=Methylophilaceae TaxID=32011 RepID=A0A0D6EW71_9PROT|nr:putative Cyclic peptide transporter [Candidatus Methylopumilus planktonicus]
MQSITSTHLFEFLKREGFIEMKSLFFLSMFVALIGTLLVALINIAATNLGTDKPITLLFFFYIALLIVFWRFSKEANRKNVQQGQIMVHKFILRMMRMVLQTELLNYEKIGATSILNAIGREAQVLSTSIPLLVGAFTSLSIVIFLIIYTAFISFTAFVILSISTLIIFLITSRALMNSHRNIMKAWQGETVNFSLYNDFLFGFQEVKVNTERSKAITSELIQLTKKSLKEKTDALVDITNFFAFLQTMLYILIGIMIFVVPMLSEHFGNDITQVATTTLFLVGSLSATIQIIPSISQANVSAMRLLLIEEELKKEANDFIDQISMDEKIESITLENILFHYKQIENTSNFTLGPINFHFAKGKIYFIRGSNGSGKTTLLRLLVGLIQPEHGSISVNGKKVTKNMLEAYRNKFAIVFNNFYLFKKLYGIANFEDTYFDEILSLMEMKEKVSIDRGQFSDLKLSTGQRKRIALMVALFENKDFIILDEWAADQDPEFRKKFYTKILPMLKNQGKTIIALTHDDAYYDVADKIIVLDNGKMAS